MSPHNIGNDLPSIAIDFIVCDNVKEKLNLGYAGSSFLTCIYFNKDEEEIRIAKHYMTKLIGNVKNRYSIKPDEYDLPQILVPHVKLEFCHFLFLN